MKNIKNKMLIIELNEFCPKYLIDNANKLNLKNLQKVLKLNHTATISPEEKEFEGLDPWVQWVSIHSGVPLKEHGVKNLGLSDQSTFEPIWNELSKSNNINWIVTGVMNSKKGSKKGCISFFPDPWSSNEKASSKELNDLLALPRYVSKNYLSLNYYLLIKKLLKTFSFFLRKKNLCLFRKTLIKLLQSTFNPGINIHTLTTLLDYVLALYFAKEKITYKPNLSIIFLNHIAHLQHHFWNSNQKIHPQMVHGLKITDEILKILIDTVEDDYEKIILINGFKQKFTGKNGIQVYRQINPKLLLNHLNIKNVKIEQNMTNESILTFNSKKDTENSSKILSNCHLSSKEKLFYIKQISKNRLFMKLDLNHHIPKDSLIISENNSIPFYKLFKNLKRTGSHVPQGDIFSKNFNLPDKIYNHEIHNYIINSFS